MPPSPPPVVLEQAADPISIPAIAPALSALVILIILNPCCELAVMY
jgi:hypothetical protein